MIDPKNLKVMSKDNIDGSRTVTVGILVRATHEIPAKQVLELSIGNKLEFFSSTHVRPLKAAVLNHIYGDLTAQVQQLKTLAKLTTDRKHQMEVYRVCTKIDQLLDMKI